MASKERREKDIREALGIGNLSLAIALLVDEVSSPEDEASESNGVFPGALTVQTGPLTMEQGDILIESGSLSIKTKTISDFGIRIRGSLLASDPVNQATPAANPNTFSGVLTDLDFQDSIIQGLSNGTTISAWSTASQPTGGLQPSKQAGGVFFDGTDDYVTFPEQNGIKSIIWVGHYTADNNNWAPIFSSDNPVNPNPFHGGGYGGGKLFEVTSTDGVLSADNVQAFVNGVLTPIADINKPLTPVILVINLDNAHPAIVRAIGGQGITGGRYFNGTVKRAMLFNRRLGSNEIIAATKHFAALYGIPYNTSTVPDIDPQYQQANMLEILDVNHNMLTKIQGDGSYHGLVDKMMKGDERQYDGDPDVLLEWQTSNATNKWIKLISNDQGQKHEAWFGLNGSTVQIGAQGTGLEILGMGIPYLRLHNDATKFSFGDIDGYVTGRYFSYGTEDQDQFILNGPLSMRGELNFPEGYGLRAGATNFEGSRQINVDGTVHLIAMTDSCLYMDRHPGFSGNLMEIREYYIPETQTWPVHIKVDTNFDFWTKHNINITDADGNIRIQLSSKNGIEANESGSDITIMTGDATQDSGTGLPGTLWLRTGVTSDGSSRGTVFIDGHLQTPYDGNFSNGLSSNTFNTNALNVNGNASALTFLASGNSEDAGNLLEFSNEQGVVLKVNKFGSILITGTASTIDMGTRQIQNLGVPLFPTQAATKAYADTKFTAFHTFDTVPAYYDANDNAIIKDGDIFILTVDQPGKVFLQTEPYTYVQIGILADFGAFGTSIIPSNDIEQALGQPGLRWGGVYAETHQGVTFTGTLSTDGTIQIGQIIFDPSGGTGGNDLEIFINGNAPANGTGIKIFTPDNGEGDSKPIRIATGVASGVRGDLILDANRVLITSGDLDMGDWNIKNVWLPSDDYDAAPKKYVDDLFQPQFTVVPPSSTEDGGVLNIGATKRAIVRTNAYPTAATLTIADGLFSGQELLLLSVYNDNLAVTIQNTGNCANIKGPWVGDADHNTLHLVWSIEANGWCEISRNNATSSSAGGVNFKYQEIETDGTTQDITSTAEGRVYVYGTDISGVVRLPDGDTLPDGTTFLIENATVNTGFLIIRDFPQQTGVDLPYGYMVLATWTTAFGGFWDFILLKNENNISIGQPRFIKETVTLTPADITAGYVSLTELFGYRSVSPGLIPNSFRVHKRNNTENTGEVIHGDEGFEYSVSEVGGGPTGYGRVTFMAPWAVGGAQELSSGDVLIVQYQLR